MRPFHAASIKCFSLNLYIFAGSITYFSCLKNKCAYQLVFLLMIRIGLQFSQSFIMILPMRYRFMLKGCNIWPLQVGYAWFLKNYLFICHSFIHYLVGWLLDCCFKFNLLLWSNWLNLFCKLVMLFLYLGWLDDSYWEVLRLAWLGWA